MSPELWIAVGSMVVAAAAGLLSYLASTRATDQQVKAAAAAEANRLEAAGLQLWARQQEQLNTAQEDNRVLRNQIGTMERENHSLRAEVDVLREKDRLRDIEVRGLRTRMLELERRYAVDDAGLRLDELERHNRDHPRPDPDEPTT